MPPDPNDGPWIQSRPVYQGPPYTPPTDPGTGSQEPNTGVPPAVPPNVDFPASNLPNLDAFSFYNKHLHDPIPGHRQPTGPIDKGGHPDPNQPGNNGCTGDQMAAMKKAIEQAQDVLRKNLEDLKTMLSGCGNDPRLDSLFQSLESLAYEDPSILLTKINCGDKAPSGDKINGEAHTEYPLDSDGNHTGNNPITINWDLIKKSANDLDDLGRNKQTDPSYFPQIFADLLMKDMLHELLHTISFTNENPFLSELDVRVLTNLLHEPRDSNGIDNNVWGEIAKDDGFTKDNPYRKDKPWLNGSFFSWDPITGEVQCGSGYTIGHLPLS